MSTKLNIFTIGLYGYTQDEFISLLKKYKIQLFIDVRQRRGVRGSKYSFGNSTKLQNILKDLNIDYLHIKELAPTLEIRDIQKNEDKKLGITKRKREELSETFRIAYKVKVLNNYDFDNFINELRYYKNILFFCVEHNPWACHRSIITEELKNRYPDTVNVKHITKNDLSRESFNCF